MQHKWKVILVNWLNCYFNESDNKEKSVTVESLLLIISYLRVNLNLDQSKSSLLEANNIEEFLAEKYPEFKFDSGTLEPSNEEEIYVVASLLLFFVCVNSKDVDIKNAMCSKLSPGDQEVILKFSKCLLDCPGVTYKDVLVAITECCGQDIAVMEGIPPVTVAETPPALRSLHGEVRRLQASLDAERFDRNYLQEELARTNLKLEKLLKDKEQSKLEVMSLKGKISLCCGQETDWEGSVNSQTLDAGRLSKQLHLAEERLGDLQAQIEDLQYERDAFKSKVEQLKEDRDKWLMLSQQEGARSQKLSEDLEVERNQNQSLKDLVQELRQHNRLNGLDASLLECDDPDASLTLHNVSVSSEACANVIEVQLGEEKAKVVALKQQIQNLQDQLDTLTQKTNDEKKHYENILLEKENDIFELKHRINEEIEEKNNMKIIHGEDVMKLNNDINELEQKLKENVENTRNVIEKKIQEIQILQEEKLSLLQSLSDETTKMDNIIKNLKTEHAAELSSKSKMKEDYENKLMKLNEKVLNRNNELVELQNNVFEKSEMIETMRIELKKEKTAKEELCNRHNDEIMTLNEKRTSLENFLQEKCDELDTRQQELQSRNSHITELNNKNDEAMKEIANLEDDCRILKESQEKLKVDVKNRDAKINQIEAKFCKEKQQLEHDIDEKNASLNSLQMQLQAEIQFKLEIQHSVSELDKVRTNLTNEIEKLKNGLSATQTELNDKEKIIHGLDLYLKEEKLTNEKLKRESKRLSDALLGKEREITKLNNKRKEEVKTWVDKLKHNRDDLTHVKNECETLSKKLQDCNLEHEKTNNEIINKLNTGLDKLIKDLRNEEVCNEMLQKYIDNNEGSSIYNKSDQLINIANVLTAELSLKKDLEKALHNETVAVSEIKTMIENKEMQINELQSKLEETQQTVNAVKSDLTKQADAYNSALELKSRDIQRLQNENNSLSIEISDAKVQLEEKVHSLQEKIMDNEKLTDKLKKSYECQIENLNIMIAKLTHYLKDKTTELDIVKKENEKFLLMVEEKKTEIKSLSDEIKTLKRNEEKLITDFESERLVLKNMITVTESVMEDQKNSQNKIIHDLTKAIEDLKDENNNLKTSLSNENKIAYKKLEEKESILNAAIKELSQVKEVNQALERKIELDSERAEKELKDYTVILEEKKQMLGNLEIQIDELLKIKEDNEKAIRILEDENNNLVQANEVLKDENNNLKTSLSKENKNAYEKLEEKESNLNAAIKELNEVKEFHKDLETKIELDRERADNEIKDFTVALEEKKQMLEKLKIQIDELLQIKEDSEKAIRILEDENNNLIQANEVLIDENNNLKTSLSNENKIAYEKLEEKESNLNAAIKELNEVKELNKALKTKIELVNEKAEKELKGSTVALEEKKQMLEKLEKQIDELFKIKEDNEKAISSLEDEKNNFVQANELLKDENNNLKTSLSNENKIAYEKLEEKESKLDEAIKELAEVKEFNQALERKIELVNEKAEQELKDSILALEEKQQMLERMKEDNGKAISVLEDEINKLVQAIDALKDENNNLKTSLSNENKIAYEKLEQKESIINKTVKELTEVKELNKALEDEKNKLVQAIDALKDENNYLKTSLSNENKIAYEKLEEEESNLNGAIKELAEVKELNQALERKIELVIEKAEQELKDSTVALQEKQLILEKVEKQMDELIKKKEDNDRAISALEDKKLILENKLQSVTIELNDVNLKYKDLEETLNIEVKEKTAALDKIQNLQENINELVNDKNEIEQVKIDLENEISNLMTITETKSLEEKKVVEKIQTENEYLAKIIEENKSVISSLEDENNNLKTSLSNENKIAYEKLEEKDSIIDAAIKELNEVKELNKALETKIELVNEKAEKELKDSTVGLEEKKQMQDKLEKQIDELLKKKEDNEKAITILEDEKNNLYQNKLDIENILQSEIESVTNALNDVNLKYNDIEQTLNIVLQEKTAALNKIQSLQENIDEMVHDKNEIEKVKIDLENKIRNMMTATETESLEEKKIVEKIQAENDYLAKVVTENKSVIINQEQLIKHELEENKKLREAFDFERLGLTNQCALLQEYQTKAEKVLLEREKEVAISREEIKTLKNKVDSYEAELSEKENKIAALNVEKEALLSSISKHLIEEKCLKETYQKEVEAKTTALYELRQKLEEHKTDSEMLNALKKENDELIKAIGQKDTFAVTSHGKLSSLKASGQGDKELRPNQVDTTPTDMTHSSNESFKTITDLEKIIHDKNRTITTLQSDVSYMKSLMAESENKLLDVTKELELSKENCQQLGIQLKKIVHAKNGEIADLKKHVNKMSATENRASQIIKVSAKYQAIILKRIAEIKSNTILKELTNYGNSNSYDSELKRSLNTGSITMEDLENFLETTDKHLRRCSEKQLSLQKERDRLTEVNRINESEIINLKKFLTELSVSFKTFNSVKDLYGQKLSRVISLQRNVRREILNMEGHLSDSIMCKLERGYAAVMQDMFECAMNLERWVERYISRTISAEKIKQAFTSDLDRASLSTNSFQNTSIEVQLEELENSFQKLLEEVARAQKGGSSRDPKEVTVMEVRAEYEDKLNRMKSKMKQLYQEQIAIFKEKQREDLAALERELLKTRQKLSESSHGYEEHIRELTNELWNVGEKFLMEKDEAAWLRKKQRTGSLMSLQHVHSSGLAAPPQLPSRPSDAHSLRSLQVNVQGTKKTDAELHMSDEEGEVFDNRWLKSLASPGAGLASAGPGRLSELQWRNSLCPPHLKSSYPAETQFQPTIDEENIKFQARAMSLGGRQQRKEVGITAYKKPGPPTPSKQAGRLSATDSELRESLRPDPDVQVSRKTSTPSRLRSLFRSDKRSDTAEGTPRSRRLSNMFRKNRRE